MNTFKSKLITFSFLLPALILFTLVMLTPFIQGFGIAFTNWNGSSRTMDFVGIKNLVTLFTIDMNATSAISNSLQFTLMSVVMVNVMGLLVAVGMSGRFRGRTALRMLMFAPIVASLVIAGFTFIYVFGMILQPILGMERSILSYNNTVMFGLALICVWRDTGLAMVIYYASIKNVPTELLEAATIDGANAIQRFFRVTFPLIAPAFTTCIALWLGWGLRVFEYPFVATGGGPGTASRTFAMFVYNHAFINNKVGYAQMAALVMFIIIVICSGSATALLRRREVDL